MVTKNGLNCKEMKEFRRLAHLANDEQIILVVDELLD